MPVLKKKIITVRVSAGTRTERVEEIGPSVLKVKVRQPPEKGRANMRIAELVAAHYGVSASCVTLVSGPVSKEKRFEILQ